MIKDIEHFLKCLSVILDLSVEHSLYRSVLHFSWIICSFDDQFLEFFVCFGHQHSILTLKLSISIKLCMAMRMWPTGKVLAFWHLSPLADTCHLFDSTYFLSISLFGFPTWFYST